MGHEGALEIEQGRTIAVLGSGVLNIYPPENQTLAQQILERGLILGENHPYASPKASLLVSRNRIITGLCQHVIVVETSNEGGAMHAVKAAMSQGRAVHTFDFPASGNHALLKNGAKCHSADLAQFQL
jgi:DNA processing protein